MARYLGAKRRSAKCAVTKERNMSGMVKACFERNEYGCLSDINEQLVFELYSR